MHWLIMYDWLCFEEDEFTQWRHSPHLKHSKHYLSVSRLDAKLGIFPMKQHANALLNGAVLIDCWGTCISPPSFIWIHTTWAVDCIMMCWWVYAIADGNLNSAGLQLDYRTKSWRFKPLSFPASQWAANQASTKLFYTVTITSSLFCYLFLELYSVELTRCYVAVQCLLLSPHCSVVNDLPCLKWPCPRMTVKLFCAEIV